MTVARRYPPELKERAREMRLEGMKVDDIAFELGVPSTTAWGWMRGLELPFDPRRQPRETTPEHKRKEIRRLYESGVTSFKEIARIVGVSCGAALWHSGADRRAKANRPEPPAPVASQEVVKFADGGRLVVSHGYSAEHARRTALALSRRRKVLSHTTEAA